MADDGTAGRRARHGILEQEGEGVPVHLRGIHDPLALAERHDEAVVAPDNRDLLQLTVDGNVVLHGYRSPSWRARVFQRPPAADVESEVAALGRPATTTRGDSATCSAAATATSSSSAGVGSTKG